MDNLIAFIQKIGLQVQTLLTGEPARFIFYGAAFVIWAVVGLANHFGFTQLGPTISLTDSLLQATVAGGVLVEVIRRYVFSQNSVVTIATNAYISGASNAARDADVAPPVDA